MLVLLDAKLKVIGVKYLLMRKPVNKLKHNVFIATTFNLEIKKMNTLKIAKKSW